MSKSRPMATWLPMPPPRRAVEAAPLAQEPPMRQLQRAVGNEGLRRLVGTSPESAERRGDPLPTAVRRDLERRFGTTLTDLRVHSDDRGAAVARGHGAVAVSSGADLYFQPGAFSPGTTRGDTILRHEVAHHLQRRRGRGSARAWSTRALELEADAAARSRSPFEVQGVAGGTVPLLMKTYVSTHGDQGYLDNAVRFYKLWENETAARVNSYQDIIDDLARAKTHLSEFRIVAHANGLNLFLPLIHDAKTYADLPQLGLQTTEALTQFYGTMGHGIGDITSSVYTWLSQTATGQAILAKLGLTAAPTGVLKELFWWSVDRHWAANVVEDPVQGQTPTTAAQRQQLAGEIGLALDAVRVAARSAAPNATDKDFIALDAEIQQAFAAQQYKWGNVDAGMLEQRRLLLKDPDRTGFRKAIAGNTFATRVAAVKQRVDAKTHIEIRGCNIGSNDAYLNGIRELFGTKPNALPSISAPKLYQFFGTPGVQVLPTNTPLPPSLKFLFNEAFTDADAQADVDKSVKQAGLQSVGGLGEVLRYGDVKKDFTAWWRMRQAKKNVANAATAVPTEKDFITFLTQSPADTFPLNAPGQGTTSLWYLILNAGTAPEAIVNWLAAQGYSLPAKADLLKTFYAGSKQLDPSRFNAQTQRIITDWLGDNFPVPDEIIFPEDPRYAANIRRLP